MFFRAAFQKSERTYNIKKENKFNTLIQLLIALPVVIKILTF
jgi:hypothetical protein